MVDGHNIPVPNRTMKALAIDLSGTGWRPRGRGDGEVI
jgi:hypothetical protein